MECPKCKSKNVAASGPSMQTVQHVITAGAVVHVVVDHWTCGHCGAAFNVAVKPAEPAKPVPAVKPAEPAKPAGSAKAV